MRSRREKTSPPYERLRAMPFHDAVGGHAAPSVRDRQSHCGLGQIGQVDSQEDPPASANSAGQSPAIARMTALQYGGRHLFR